MFRGPFKGEVVGLLSSHFVNKPVHVAENHESCMIKFSMVLYYSFPPCFIVEKYE